jgi:hypothetical protein
MGESLKCEECGAEPDFQAHGWRAFIAPRPEEDEPPEVVVYCPECAEREFGDAADGA